MIGIKQILTAIMNIIKVQTEVGAIYITTSSSNPSKLFGGNWSKIEGRFLVGAGNKYAVKSTGGAANTIHLYHKHSCGNVFSNGSGKTSAYTMSSNRKRTTKNTTYTGTNGGYVNRNMPQYYVVNIWRRTS